MDAKILLVEDDSSIAELIERNLQAAGFSTRHVAEGDLALGAVRFMKLQKLLTDLADAEVLQIGAEDLQNVLGQSRVLYEIETHLAGPIRILELAGHILVRERRNKIAADRFVSARLETYERMWDGCGCKIDCLG